MVSSLVTKKLAKIERYLRSNRLLEQDVKTARDELEKFKTMTVEEVAKMGMRAFAERLKENIPKMCKMDGIDTVIVHRHIDNLAKEMAGDKNGRA